MPSSPHLTPRILVLLLAIAVTTVSTWVTLSLDETPENPLSWPRLFLVRLFGSLRNGGRKRVYWSGILVYSGVVSVLHFGGLYYDVYGAINQWDFLTHVLSGAGVAILLYLTFHLEKPGRSLRWIVPAVLAFGAGFEIYEFLLKDFWHGWTLRYYLVDTVLDLGSNVLGALLAVGALGVRRS
ncbi:MAG: hypothetical protein U5K70_02740 [Halodesulfurarchaeum sp.]|nr:hypothetical protein [Halodesulfurarchaeum sp.]